MIEKLGDYSTHYYGSFKGTCTYLVFVFLEMGVYLLMGVTLFKRGRVCLFLFFF